MRRTITRSALAPAQWLSTPPDASDGYAALHRPARRERPDLAREIAQSAAVSKRDVDGRRLRAALAEELEARFEVQAVLGRGEARPRIVALVGPPGLRQDHHPGQAGGELRPGGAPAGNAAVDRHLPGGGGRAIALLCRHPRGGIPTGRDGVGPGSGHRGASRQGADFPRHSRAGLGGSGGLLHAWAQFLSTREDIDTQLVVSSSMKSADLSRVVDSFEPFRPQRLIFTKLDETGSFGPIFNEAVRTGKPLSFFTNGQRIPEDLEAATKGRVAELILGGSTGLRPVGGIEDELVANLCAPYAVSDMTSDDRRERLILEHLPQVRLIARRIQERLPENISLEDLVSTGVIGLIAAIDNFDASHNVKLKTYAEYKIRGAILDSLRGLDWAPRQKRRKAKRIEAAIAAAEQRLQRAPDGGRNRRATGDFARGISRMAGGDPRLEHRQPGIHLRAIRGRTCCTICPTRATIFPPRSSKDPNWSASSPRVSTPSRRWSAPSWACITKKN